MSGVKLTGCNWAMPAGEQVLYGHIKNALFISLMFFAERRPASGY
jgi:hypothetical protein